MNNEEKKDMENLILEAAKTVFLRKGFVATKMSDIATEAGISRTSLRYMPGRFSLYQDLTVEENLTFFATLFISNHLRIRSHI